MRWNKAIAAHDLKGLHGEIPGRVDFVTGVFEDFPDFFSKGPE